MVYLSRYKIALVGGHPNSYRRTAKYFQAVYRLSSFIHVPSRTERSISRSKILDKLKSCDLIVVITRYIDHPLIKIVMKLKASNAIQATMLHIHTKGHSSIVREITAYVESNWLSRI